MKSDLREWNRMMCQHQPVGSRVLPSSGFSAVVLFCPCGNIFLQCELKFGTVLCTIPIHLTIWHWYMYHVMLLSVKFQLISAGLWNEYLVDCKKLWEEIEWIQMKSLSQGAGHNAHDQFYYICCSSILQTPQRGAKRRLRLMMTQSCKFCFFPATFPNMSI